jgi:hypothetical protein
MMLPRAAGHEPVVVRLTAITHAVEQVNLYEFRPVSGAPEPKEIAGVWVRGLKLLTLRDYHVGERAATLRLFRAR